MFLAAKQSITELLSNCPISRLEKEETRAHKPDTQKQGHIQLTCIVSFLYFKSIPLNSKLKDPNPLSL